MCFLNLHTSTCCSFCHLKWSNVPLLAEENSSKRFAATLHVSLVSALFTLQQPWVWRYTLSSSTQTEGPSASMSGTQPARRSLAGSETATTFRDSVQLSCLTWRPGSLTRMFPTGIETWYGFVKTFPLCCVGTRWISRIERWRQSPSSSTGKRTYR